MPVYGGSRYLETALNLLEFRDGEKKEVLGEQGETRGPRETPKLGFIGDRRLL